MRPVLLGVALGIGSLLSPGSLAIALLVLATWRLLGRASSEPDRRFVRRIFLAGFCARLLLSLSLDLGSGMVEGQWPLKRGPTQGWDLGITDRTREYLNVGDSDYYSQRGYAIAQYAKGVEEPVVMYRIRQYGWHGYAYVIGLFYHLFGFSPISVKFINCLLGALLGPVLFYLARSCFNASIAKWSSLTVSFFPSLLFWSATNLKEAGFHLLTALLLLFFVRIRQGGWGKGLFLYAPLFLLAGVAHATLRSIGFTLVLVICLLASEGILTLVRRRLWIALAVALVIGIGGLSQMNWKSTLWFCFYRHVNYVFERGASYRYLPKELYVVREYSELASPEKMRASFLIPTVTRAVFHFLAEPLPQRIDNLSVLAVYPQMAFWYLLLPCALVGLLGGLWWNLNRVLFLVMVLVMWTLMAALPSGNVGTAFRMRDMVTPLFILFAGAGFWALLHGGRRLAER